MRAALVSTKTSRTSACGERTITACARYAGAINVTAPSGEQAPILLAPHGLTDAVPDCPHPISPHAKQRVRACQRLRAGSSPLSYGRCKTPVRLRIAIGDDLMVPRPQQIPGAH